MVHNRAVYSLAKHLLAISTDNDDFVCEEKVSAVLQILRDKKPRHHRVLLKLYLKRVRMHIDKSIAKIEYMGEMDAKQLEALKKNLEANYSRSLHMKVTKNSHLIAGFLVQVGNDVWDASVAGRLGSLSKTI